MKLSMPFLLAGLCLLAPHTVPALADKGSTAPAPIGSWKTGDSWTIAVELYSYNGLPEAAPVVERFPMRVLIAGTGQTASALFWKVDFIGGMGAPSSVKEPYRVWVDQATGWPRKVNRVSDGATAAVVAFGDARMVTIAPTGFPLEIFAVTGSAVITPAEDDSVLRVTRQVEGENLTLEAHLTVGTVEKLLVRQKWVNGEKWWRQYERYVNGKLDLVARRDGMPLVTLKPTEKAEQPDPFVLAKDPRLAAKIPNMGGNPPLDVILQNLNGATGLTFTIADNLNRHDPEFGDVSGLGNAPASVLMAMVAQHQLEGGNWLKSENGYHLAAARSLREKPLPPLPPGWDRHRMLAAGLMALLLLTGTCIILMRRRAAKPPTAQAPPAG